MESLHVYKHRPSLADNKYSETDLYKVGMTIFATNHAEALVVDQITVAAQDGKTNFEKQTLYRI